MSEENWLDFNQENIFYKKTGNGPIVVLIHGFAEDGTIWDKQTDFLKNYFQLVIPDLPGSGRSEASQQLAFGSRQLTIEDYADIINQVLDKEKISSCIIIGHSMGGYIALAFAEKHPDKLKAITLFHSTAFADNEEKKANRRKSIEFMRKHGAPEFVKQSSPNLFSEYTKSNHPEIINELISRYDNSNTAALVSYYESMIQRPDRTNVLQNFNKPIQFIIGEGDNAVPLEQSLRQCHLPKISYIHIPESTGHMGMWEATNEVNYFLLAFINQVSA
jgi:pimeloyl-ACP methyl ester carboxylesterase